MQIFYNFLQKIDRIRPFQIVDAHCDIPCGIYDPKTAQIAAATVLKMIRIIKGIDQASKTLDDRNTLVRAIWTKEEHARKCKEEILILWTDYFKPEHFEKFPYLTNKILATAKLCSYNKQHVDEEKAQELVNAVDEIAEIFKETKASK